MNTKIWRKPFLRLPFQDPYTPVTEDAAPSLLESGTYLSVEGPDQSTKLPMLSTQDWAEFQSFEKGEITGHLENEQLATDLIYLKNQGVKFNAYLNGQHEKVGAYGAYNFLTNELGINSLTLAFSQPVPSTSPKNLATFQGLMSRIRMSEDLVKDVPEEHKDRLRHLYFQTAVSDSEAQHPQVLRSDALASKNLFRQEDWPTQGSDRGIIGAAYDGFSSLFPRIHLVKNILSLTDESGKKHVAKHWKAERLYRLALETKLSSEDFFFGALRNIEPSATPTVGLALASSLFPEPHKKAGKLIKESPSDIIRTIHYSALLASINHPEVQDPKALIGLTLKSLRKREIKPEVVSQFIEKVVEPLADSTPRLQKVLGMLSSKGQNGELRISQAATRHRMIEMSLRPELNEAEFTEALFDSGDKSDRLTVLNVVSQNQPGTRSNPTMQAAIKAHLEHATAESREEQAYWLTRLTFEKPEIESLGELIQAIEPRRRKVSWGFAKELYLTALRADEDNPRAAKALRVATDVQKGGLPKNSSNSSLQTLHAATLDRELSPHQFLTKAMGSDPSLGEPLLREVYPERHQKVSKLSRFTDWHEREYLHGILVQASLETAEELSTVELVNRALSKLRSPESYERDLYRAAAKEKSASSKRAKYFLKLAESKNSSGTNVRSSSTLTALYKAALDESKDPVSLVEKVVNESDRSDKSFIRRQLTEEFLPDWADRVSALTFHSPRETEADHWDLLMRTVQENPQASSTELVSKARKKFGSVEDPKERHFVESLWRLALQENSLTNPRAAKALEIDGSGHGERMLKSLESTETLYRESLKPNTSELDYVTRVVEGAAAEDKTYLLRKLGQQLVDEIRTALPPEVLQKFEASEMSIEELKSLFLLAKPDHKRQDSAVEVQLEDDILRIGNEELTVDL